MPKYTAERIAEIRGHLDDLEKRGVSVATFAREVGVSAWTIYLWKRRFGDCPAEEQAEARRAMSPDRADVLEVRGLLPAAEVEIHLGDAVVRVPRGSDPETLQAAIRAVRSC